MFDGAVEKVVEEHKELKHKRSSKDATKEYKVSHNLVTVLLDMSMNDTINIIDKNITMNNFIYSKGKL